MFNLCADNTKLENLTFLMRHSVFFFVDFVTDIISQFAVSEVFFIIHVIDSFLLLFC